MKKEITHEQCMETLDAHREILEAATKLLDEYIETQTHDTFLHMQMSDSNEVEAYAYDSENVFFQDRYGFSDPEEGNMMPLAFVYSQDFRDRLKQENIEKLAEQKENQAKAKAHRESVAYKLKEAQFEQLKKELGK